MNYNHKELEELGVADIYDDNGNVYGCIYEGGEIEFYPKTEDLDTEYEEQL